MTGHIMDQPVECPTIYLSIYPSTRYLFICSYQKENLMNSLKMIQKTIRILSYDLCVLVRWDSIQLNSILFTQLRPLGAKGDTIKHTVQIYYNIYRDSVILI
jgi:hypothetical protein